MYDVQNFCAQDPMLDYVRPYPDIKMQSGFGNLFGKPGCAQHQHKNHGNLHNTQETRGFGPR